MAKAVATPDFRELGPTTPCHAAAAALHIWRAHQRVTDNEMKTAEAAHASLKRCLILAAALTFSVGALAEETEPVSQNGADFTVREITIGAVQGQARRAARLFEPQPHLSRSVGSQLQRRQARRSRTSTAPTSRRQSARHRHVGHAARSRHADPRRLLRRQPVAAPASCARPSIPTSPKTSPTRRALPAPTSPAFA